MLKSSIIDLINLRFLPEKQQPYHKFCLSGCEGKKLKKRTEIKVLPCGTDWASQTLHGQILDVSSTEGHDFALEFERF